MSNIPLTEKRFLELLQINNDSIYNYMNKRFDTLEESMNKQFNLINIRLKNLENYQNNESNAIEYELRELLFKYLKDKYSHFRIKDFPIKTPYDPYTDKPLTDLDAAYIITPYEHISNIKRLTEKIKLDDKTLKKYPTKQTFSNENIFILAEAKHHINLYKIKRKLTQFNSLRRIFLLAKQQKESNSETLDSEILYSETIYVTDKFRKTVNNVPILSEIDESILFFGAPYWENNLLVTFQDDLNMFKKNINEYNNIADNIYIIDKIEESEKKSKLIENINKKIKLYSSLCSIAKKYYDTVDVPTWCSTINKSNILNHKIEDDSLLRIHIIKPSGNRYHVSEEMDIQGISTIALTGGNRYNKTRRIK